jgi:hypothetical protein
VNVVVTTNAAIAGSVRRKRIMGIVPIRIPPRNRSSQPFAAWGWCLDLDQAENVRALLDWPETIRSNEAIQHSPARKRESEGRTHEAASTSPCSTRFGWIADGGTIADRGSG